MKCNDISRSLPRFCCCCGDHMRPLYKTELCKDGTIRLHEAGFQDTDEFIESFRQSTELRTLIARFTAGDTSVFSSVPVFDGDFAEFPSSLQQAFEILKTAENAFASVSPESKAAYGNDFVKWISDYGSPEFLKSCGIDLPASENVNVSPDVKGGESE